MLILPCSGGLLLLHFYTEPASLSCQLRGVQFKPGVGAERKIWNIWGIFMPGFWQHLLSNMKHRKLREFPSAESNLSSTQTTCVLHFAIPTTFILRFSLLCKVSLYSFSLLLKEWSHTQTLEKQPPAAPGAGETSGSKKADCNYLREIFAGQKSQSMHTNTLLWKVSRHLWQQLQRMLDARLTKAGQQKTLEFLLLTSWESLSICLQGLLRLCLSMNGIKQPRNPIIPSFDFKFFPTENTSHFHLPAEAEKPFWPGCPCGRCVSASSITAALQGYLLTRLWNTALLESSSISPCPPTLLQPLVPLQRHNILQTCLQAWKLMLVFKNIAKIGFLYSWLGTLRDSLIVCCFLAPPNQISGMSYTPLNVNVKIIYICFPGTFFVIKKA